MATGLNLNSNLHDSANKIDLVLYPAREWGLVNVYMNKVLWLIWSNSFQPRETNNIFSNSYHFFLYVFRLPFSSSPPLSLCLSLSLFSFVFISFLLLPYFLFPILFFLSFFLSFFLRILLF